MAAPSSTIPKWPRNAVSTKVISVCAKFPTIIGTAREMMLRVV